MLLLLNFRSLCLEPRNTSLHNRQWDNSNEKQWGELLQHQQRQCHVTCEMSTQNGPQNNAIANGIPKKKNKQTKTNKISRTRAFYFLELWCAGGVDWSGRMSRMIGGRGYWVGVHVSRWIDSMVGGRGCVVGVVPEWSVFVPYTNMAIADRIARRTWKLVYSRCGPNGCSIDATLYSRCTC